MKFPCFSFSFYPPDYIEYGRVKRCLLIRGESALALVLCADSDAPRGTRESGEISVEGFG
jgi:hypothetical protein